MPNREQCLQALDRYKGSVEKAANSMGLSRHQFRRIVKNLNMKQSEGFSYERWRNRGTTQIEINKGLVIRAPDNFDLYLSSDWHSGSESCYYPGLHDMVNAIKKDSRARLIGGGDHMEVTPHGKHDGGRNSDSLIDGQIIRTTNGLKPIKKKIDLLYGGNHGRPRLANVGIDPDLIMASMLGVPYSPVPTVVRYVMPNGILKVCGGHGSSGAQDALRELRRLREVYPNCHVYHLGHDHSLFAEPDGAMEYDENGDEFWSPAWMCRTGSFLRYGDYARYGLMRPKPTGYLIAHIRKAKVASIEVVKV